MSFLLGDDYASSSSESESDREEAVTTRPTLKDADEVKGSPGQLLPSADSVLSSVSASRASFLAPRSGAKQQSAVKSFDLLEERNPQRCEQQTEEREEADRSAETHRSDRKRPPPPVAREQAAKRDKKDAKERVKNQRVKGQAGIGSDFRGWKSEMEMALRQQFD
ncbi:uncharacterized protein KRP23_895 [Phytophthora ramorum]|uniref:Uncharacterized protein n=1 Tax=Phytophthora ramorum TaxID=164328 RepID=H3GG16_PHYRM|nr:hypothetical protein KRP23_895 [Phytophthora ramorum]